MARAPTGCLTNRGILATAVIGALVIVFAFTHRKRAFDPNGWRDARAEKNYAVMFGMAEDIVRKVESQKPSRDEVLLLLGEPDVNTPTMARYGLGSHSRGTLLPDGWNLTIYFDEFTGQLREVHLHPG